MSMPPRMTKMETKTRTATAGAAKEIGMGRERRQGELQYMFGREKENGGQHSSNDILPVRLRCRSAAVMRCVFARRWRSRLSTRLPYCRISPSWFFSCRLRYRTMFRTCNSWRRHVHRLD